MRREEETYSPNMYIEIPTVGGFGSNRFTARLAITSSVWFHFLKGGKTLTLPMYKTVRRQTEELMRNHKSLIWRVKTVDLQFLTVTAKSTKAGKKEK